MIAITTSSSISVNAGRDGRRTWDMEVLLVERETGQTSEPKKKAGESG